MSIDRNSVNKCQHVSVTRSEQTKWKHNTQNSAIYLYKRLNRAGRNQESQSEGVTNEILDMMEERGLLKHNEGLYIQKGAEIQR